MENLSAENFQLLSDCVEMLSEFDVDLQPSNDTQAADEGTIIDAHGIRAPDEISDDLYKFCEELLGNDESVSFINIIKQINIILYLIFYSVLK
jgi:hypothetical protein